MKITIVVDTDDDRGIRDSFKIVSHFRNKIDDRGGSGRNLRFGKIAFIKMIRAFAREAKAAEERGENSTSLRFTKDYTDRLFAAEESL